MIIVKPKPIEQVLEMVGGSSQILVLGCDSCTAVTQAGGEKQAETTALLLEMGLKIRGRNDVKVKPASILRQCDRQMVAIGLRPLVGDYGTILSLACGVGVQTVADIFQNKIVYPMSDTMFIGSHDREVGEFTELCKACGECILHETDGICPVTRCAKALLNGPCGGFSNGKCEVGGWKNDCAWVLIFNRLKARDRLDLFVKFRPPRDYRVSQSPRRLGGV